MEESIRKQKQFITDASHELKTPLTIIDANTEVIEMETGENQWTKSTRKQIQRLSGMVQQLVALSRLDENRDIGEKQNFLLLMRYWKRCSLMRLLSGREEKKWNSW